MSEGIISRFIEAKEFQLTICIFFILNRLHSYTTSSYILNGAAESNCFNNNKKTVLKLIYRMKRSSTELRGSTWTRDKGGGVVLRSPVPVR